MLNWLEKWFDSQCNGDWEHNYGIKIETLDNPGWEVTIDLNNTDIYLNPKSWILFGNFEKKWIGYKIENNKFNGAGTSLSLIIQIFKNLIEKKLINEKDFIKKLES
ncbi:hypothetical protein ACM39_18325 [Chryseobacterium sp. FH2]|uniref:immunity 53 family protein n=1 Tax=Chryseobacterium sp. FH2 TaxID=1674291 RepID=UPI00065CCCEB|nr:immunity 53 family protein [Chryseobacterium sp. FH2]KMQ59917.1 hypothetical protein ACM39_18325 [Chryseobacterium sp. FH2]